MFKGLVRFIKNLGKKKEIEAKPAESTVSNFIESLGDKAPAIHSNERIEAEEYKPLHSKPQIKSPIDSLVEGYSFKIASAMSRGYASTRTKIDLDLYGNYLEDIQNKVLESNSTVRSVTIKHIGESNYIVFQLSKDSEGHYVSRDSLNQ
jgi:hypothetical protein